MQNKIENSIKLIQQYAPIADKYGGYSVMFSGGKDSEVMLDLFKKSGVKFHAYYCVTTNDPPENVYFIKKHFPEVEFLHPKLTFLQLIEKKGMLPTRVCRFCCANLKESRGKGVVAVGVRREESRTRKNYATIEFERHRPFDEKRMRKNRKVLFRPILEWNEAEIWQYIEDNNLPVNPLYETRGRVGCLFCPFASKIELEHNRKKYPKFYTNLLRTIQKCIDGGKFKMFDSKEDVWAWWISKLPIKDYKEQNKNQCDISQ